MTFSAKELDFLFGVARRLTGSSLSFRPDIIPFNIGLRMHTVKKKTLLEYIEFALSDQDELGHLLSAVTIHTTRWFRDSHQLEIFFKWVEAECISKKLKKICVLSAGASSGQEAYSLALGMESLVKRGLLKDYHIDGWDIDPLVIGLARRGHYDKKEVETHVPEKYRSLLHLKKFNDNEVAYVIPDEIKKKVDFKTFDLLNGSYKDHPSYNTIFCRNVIIYFDPEAVNSIIRNLNSCLVPHGHLYLATGEHVEAAELGLNHQGHGGYEKGEVGAQGQKGAKGEIGAKGEKESPHTSSQTPHRPDVFTLRNKVPKSVLIVDDEVGITELVSDMLKDKGVQVTTFNDPLQAASLTEEQVRSFNLAFLDFNMPGLDGLSLLKKLRHADHDLPVIMVTAVKSKAIIQSFMNEGVSDIISKPFREDDILGSFRYSTVARLHSVTAHELGFDRMPDLVLLGSSTGGPKALESALQNLPPNCPPVVVVQHIGEDFSKDLMAQILKASGLKNGMDHLEKPLSAGCLYMAQADAHITLKKKNGLLYVSYLNGERVESHRPSVDVMFQSAALLTDTKIVAGLFTGMGRDGAQGLYDLRKSGASTFAQNQASCMIFGMPREAIMMGAAILIGTPEDFNDHLKKYITNQKAA